MMVGKYSVLGAALGDGFSFSPTVCTIRAEGSAQMFPSDTLRLTFLLLFVSQVLEPL